MTNQTEATPQQPNFIGMIIDKILKRLPSDPLSQTRFMYYLQTIILITLTFFTITNIANFIFTWKVTYLLGAVLTTVFGLMSLFSYKQIRTAYLSLKGTQQALNEITPEQIEERLKELNKKK